MWIVVLLALVGLVDLQDTAIEQNEITSNNELELETLDPELKGQIIGGVPSSVTRHPYQVSLVINGNSFCGGFIISRNYVLTAAHCVQNVSPSSIKLRAGSTRWDRGGIVVPVARIIVHEGYGRPLHSNDIAALRLQNPLVFNENIRPVGLPRQNQAIPQVRLIVTGWGMTAPGSRTIPRELREAQVPVVPQWLCRLSYGNALTNNMFCAGHYLIGGTSSCQGDSGGPAVFRGVSYGVVSFARGCAIPLSPTVFTNVASERNWIRANTGV